MHLTLTENQGERASLDQNDAIRGARGRMATDILDFTPSVSFRRSACPRACHRWTPCASFLGEESAVVGTPLFLQARRRRRRSRRWIDSSSGGSRRIPLRPDDNSISRTIYRRTMSGACKTVVVVVGSCVCQGLDAVAFIDRMAEQRCDVAENWHWARCLISAHKHRAFLHFRLEFQKSFAEPRYRSLLRRLQSSRGSRRERVKMAPRRADFPGCGRWKWSATGMRNADDTRWQTCYI